MPPIPLLTGAYANLASEEWILEERQQLRSLYDIRLVDFHQSYVDDVSWLNEYMAGLCETVPSKGENLADMGSVRRDILQAMKTPSRFQSVRKLNSAFDLRGAKPVGRLFSDSSVNAEPSRTVSTSSSEPVEQPKSQQIHAQSTTTRQEVRGSLIIHHDAEEAETVELASIGGDSMLDLSEDSFTGNSSDHDTRIQVEDMPQPLNEIVEVEDEDDEVVTVLKTPHANPLTKGNTVDELLESPLAGKTAPSIGDMDAEGSDKENMPASPLRRDISTPRPSSQRSDSYVTAATNFPSEDPPEPEEQQPQPSVTESAVAHQDHEEIIETQVPVATSPKHEMHLPSLPTRAPLNMKKSFGVRKSHRTSLMETLARRSSAIPNWKTLFGQAKETTDNPTASTSTSAESVSKPIERPASPKPPIQAAVTPTDEIVNPVMTTNQSMDEAPRKEKDDTITFIDTELHLGEQRLKTKFTTDSQRIQDALNSLRTKSTPGQPLRDAHNSQGKILEAQTPAPVRSADGQDSEIDEEEEWIPKKDYSSLAERLANENEETRPTHQTQSGSIISENQSQPEVHVEKTTITTVSPQPIQVPIDVDVASIQSSSTLNFKNAAAQAAEVIRNAMAFMTNPTTEPSPPKPQSSPTPAQKSTNLYPRLDDDSDELMTDVQVNENFTVHYDDRASLDSRRDSTYFTQSEAPSQPSQVDIEPPSQPTQPTQVHAEKAAMPPPRKEQPPAKPKPVSIRVQTASQRSKEQQKKVQPTTHGTGIYPILSQSRSVPDLATPAKLAREEARMSSVSVQSTGTFVKGAGQIKALNAAKLAKQREEQEREKKAAKKFEMERKRQEVLQRQKERQEEERRKQLAAQKKTIVKDDKKRPAAEPFRPTKKQLPTSPQKKNPETAKPQRPGAVAPQPKGIKHTLETEEVKTKAVNYTGTGKPMGQPQHGQDTKRRRTEEIDEKEVISNKPMRVSAIKQEIKPMKSIGEPVRQPYTAEPKKGIKISAAHQHALPAKNFMAPAEGVKFSNDPIPFGKPAPSQGKRSGPGPMQSTKEPVYPPSESIILPEIDSEYSDSEDDSPKKSAIVKPAWAESPVLVAQLKRQQLINPDDVFGEIKPPAIDDIFRDNRRRGHSTFRPRSSSANWSGQDKLTREEIEEYAKSMGYSKP